VLIDLESNRIPLTNRSGRNKTISILVALVLVAVAAYGTLFYFDQSQKGDAVPISIVSYGTSLHSPSSPAAPAGIQAQSEQPLQNVTVSVFGIVPNSLRNNELQAIDLESVNESNNSYQDLLFRGLTNSKGAISGKLSPAFNEIVSEWKALTTPASINTVSLALYANYGVVENGTLYTYSYYNNLPYDPFSPVSSYNFDVNFVLNLSNPTTVTPLVGSIMAPSAVPLGIPPPPPCDPGYYYYLYNQSSVTGNFPVEVTYLNDSSDVDTIAAGYTMASGTMSYSFNSATSPYSTSVPSSSVDMSESPSVSSNSLSISGFNVQTASTSSEVISEMYIPNATITITNYDGWHVTGSGSDCTDTFLGYQTTIEVSGVNLSGSDPIHASANDNSYYGWTINNEFNMQSIDNFPLGPSDSISNISSYLDQVSGWSSAASEEQTAMNALSVFSASLGLALAIIDAAGIIPEGSEAADLASTLDVLNSQLGFKLALISAFESISYSTTYTFVYTSYGITNVLVNSGNSLNVALYDSSYSTVLTIGGVNYPVSMPQLYYYVTS
jgi:hypothetical protein